MSIVSVMPSSHLILCRPLLLLPPVPPSIRVFSKPVIRCARTIEPPSARQGLQLRKHLLAPELSNKRGQSSEKPARHSGEAAPTAARENLRGHEDPGQPQCK
ncbi:unnamed protein product [Rangifer tarandus platyrhynchus]|uniref:Uncharacterized protein n=1 Tax=Rangifer tarandus platyrhynchus TaxID=3082113 RepID=A0AC59Z2L9_RANTA